jgi:large subunit ribosomal protein L15
MRGFNNARFTVRFVSVNLDVLEKLATDYGEINRDVLVEAGIVKSKEVLVKILGDGKLTKAVRVTADKFSEKAKQGIEAAGGSVVGLVLK